MFFTAPIVMQSNLFTSGRTNKKNIVVDKKKSDKLNVDVFHYSFSGLIIEYMPYTMLRKSAKEQY